MQQHQRQAQGHLLLAIGVALLCRRRLQLRRKLLAHEPALLLRRDAPWGLQRDGWAGRHSLLPRRPKLLLRLLLRPPKALCTVVVTMDILVQQ